MSWRLGAVGEIGQLAQGLTCLVLAGDELDQGRALLRGLADGGGPAELG